MGGVPLENIICLNNGIRHYDQKILTKTIVALRGTLENNIQYNKGIHYHDQGILTKANLAYGGGFLEKKIRFKQEIRHRNYEIHTKTIIACRENF